MRSKSLISIIRKYGINSKRLNPRNHIKYEDAIKAIKGYETSELEILRVVDNVLYPNESISKKCQVPGCGHNIRYEYHLRNKFDSTVFVAGSTCVWPLLGLSELEKKSFNKYDEAVREYYALEQWKKDNPDVLDKLDTLKQENILYYKPFWREIESSRLTDEDTEYIRSLDVNKIVESRREKARLIAERKAMNAVEKALADAEYEKVINGLHTLSKRFPENNFYQSLERQAKRYKLSVRQQECVKKGINKLWYEDKIKGTAYDCWNTCECSVETIIKKNQPNAVVSKSYIRDNKSLVEDMFKAVNKVTKMAWNVYKVKYELV